MAISRENKRLTLKDISSCWRMELSFEGEKPEWRVRLFYRDVLIDQDTNKVIGEGTSGAVELSFIEIAQRFPQLVQQLQIAVDEINNERTRDVD